MIEPKKDPHVQQVVDTYEVQVRRLIAELRQRLGTRFHGNILAPLTIIFPGSKSVTRDIKG